MSEALALQRPAVALPWKLLRLFPGVALLFSIGYAGKLTEALLRDYGKTHHVAMPNIEYVLWAILFGLVIANTVGVAQIFRPGVGTYDFWLKAGIVLLGARFLLGDVLKLGGVSLAMVAIELVVAVLIMTVLGKWFKLKPKLTSLLAVGSSICGVSAIIAAKGAIEADDDDATFAIAAILALGAFGLFAYPAASHRFALWGGETYQFPIVESLGASLFWTASAALFRSMRDTCSRSTPSPSTRVMLTIAGAWRIARRASSRCWLSAAAVHVCWTVQPS